jgi:hypothetical protein
VIYVFNKVRWDIVANEGLLYLFMGSVAMIHIPSSMKIVPDIQKLMVRRDSQRDRMEIA